MEAKQGGWTVTKLVGVSTLGVLYLLFSLVGATLPALTGIPMSSGIVNFVVSAAMYVFGVLVVDKFGTGMLMGIIFATLALPLPLYGAPGFVPKLLIGVATGLAADLSYLLFHKRPLLAAYAIGASTQITITLLVAGLGVVFAMPGIEKMISFFVTPLTLGLIVVLGGAAGLLGYWLFRKLKDRTIVRRIRFSGTFVDEEPPHRAADDHSGRQGDRGDVQ